MHPKLTWVNSMAVSLGAALGCSIQAQMVDDEVDPLKKYVHLIMGEDIGKKDWNPIQVMIHSWAKINDCAIFNIKRQDKGRRLILETTIKRRFGPTMDKNPLDKG